MCRRLTPFSPPFVNFLYPTGPAYARVGAPRRFFGWALFCLGVSQYNLEEQELEMMRDHNTQFREQAFRETEAATQAKFLADLEKRKQAEAAAAAAKH
jgi:hypothetical protein